MNSLTVLYDSSCPLCEWATRWLSAQRQIVPIYFIAAGSKAAFESFPWLDHSKTRTDTTVVGDDGSVYSNERAWIACLWCLRNYRSAAKRLSNPVLMPRVKAFVALVSRYRPVSDDNCTEESCGY